MTLIFIIMSEYTAQGSRYQEVCVWTFFFLQFSYRFFFSLCLSLFIFLYIAQLYYIFVLALLVHLDKQGFWKKTRSKSIFRTLISTILNCSSTIQDKSGKCLTEEKEILSRWTEYCSELYNYESCGDNTVLDCSQPPEEDLQPILREEVEIAVASLKKGKSAGVDNIPAELVQAGGETMIDVLTEICNRIWRTGEWPTPWTQSLIITLPKKGNLQLCQNYRTISLISHSSKVMLKVILNRLKPQAEEIIAEEQAGFRAGRSTTEQIFNLRILCEKYLQHQENLYHVFIDFKKAFDRVWHAALWATMRKY